MEDYSIATENAILGAEEQQRLGHIPKVNTPFGYFGSKNKLAFQLCNKLPPHSCWVEAFCGSAALTLAKKIAPIEVINDIDGEIVNVFRQLRNNHVELCRSLSLTPYAKEELESARASNIDDSELERARKFFVQAMMAINGIFGEEKGGFSYSQSYSRNGRDARVNRWYNLPERLAKVVERLKNVRIDNRNAIDIVDMFSNRPATLLYLDPPYLGDRSKGYTNDEYSEDFHTNLLKAARKSKCMIFISSYESQLYSSMLDEKNGWSRLEIKTITKDSKGQSHERTELVWMNKYFTHAQEKGKINIMLTKEEEKQKKLNPERKSFRL